jgi:hypothetical protein
MLRASALLLAFATGGGAAQPPPTGNAAQRSQACNGVVPPVAYRNLVASSHLILVGVAEPPTSESDRADSYRRVHVRVTGALKGEPGAEVDVRFFEGPGSHPPGTREIAALVGRPALFHLLRVDEQRGTVYFAGDAEALAPATAANVAAARQEVARQQGLLTNWAPDPSWPHLHDVAMLLSELASLQPGGRFTRSRQERIFARLEALGQPAVLAMIAHIDDTRRLALPEISLENHFPGAFEARRFYGPQTIGDALAAILNQITSEGFGFTYNGGSERERLEATNGWRVYAADLVCGRR